MIKQDMKNKMEIARQKVEKAIEKDNGTTLMSTGMTGDDARLAKAAVAGGAKILEANHPAVTLARGLEGVSTMGDAEYVRHELPLKSMLECVKGVRAVVGPDIYLTVGFPGSFTEREPIPLTSEDFRQLALAGADGVHCHKSSLADLKDVVTLAHENGLLVDSYIGKKSDLHQFGIGAEDITEVKKVALAMQEIGADFIGMMTGMSYEGVAAGEIPQEIKDRLQALIETVSVPTFAEGGINEVNVKAFKNTGVNVVTVGTAMDDYAEGAIKSAVAKFINHQ